MSTREQYESALRASDPVNALRDVIVLQRNAGLAQSAVLAELESFRELLRDQNRDSDEDTVCDVMDFVVGWCSPHMKIEFDTASPVIR